jgi:ABC-type glycerol-3-phosphate transport system substrate-binding protein
LFLKFLTAAENQVTWTTATSYFPINLEAAANLGDFETANPYFATANALVSAPDVTIYSSPQVVSYAAVRSIIPKGWPMWPATGAMLRKWLGDDR